jgi:hypothetical protein
MNLISEIHPTYYILIVIISIALYTDATKYKIYNWLTFPSLFLGFICSRKRTCFGWDRYFEKKYSSTKMKETQKAYLNSLQTSYTSHHTLSSPIR